ncbi:MAG: RHS repeat-associated core domain-containing protein, partial [Bacteroidales bacterium]
MSEIEDILKRIKRSVYLTDPDAQILLYGSYARGDYDERSDIDLIILLDKKKITREDEKRIKYLYNGKEFQDELDLNLYDYGARFYDPSLGRFTGVDPLPKPHESVYAAFSNNPIVFVDPDGRDTLDIIKNDAGKWSVSNTQIVKGDDVFRVNTGDET